MIICLSTASPTCIFRVIDGSSESNHDWLAGRELASSLHAHIIGAVSDIRNISAIVVHSGPGSFTGLRIGITVANTLADSLGIPIIGQQGDEWMSEGLIRLEQGQDDLMVMPEYGSLANITVQKK